MTKEEIKEQTNMTDILNQYGIQVIRGMCKCPFHDDRKPSMKVFKDGVTCFTCGESWDVFGFVMKIDNCDFKTAFRALGGTYAKQDNPRARAIAKARFEAEKARRTKTRKTNRDMERTLVKALIICQNADIYEPYSDEWCYLKNKLSLIEFYYEERLIHDSQELNDLDVYRECSELIKRFISV